jgi:ketosteroid isomerase-like protein
MLRTRLFLFAATLVILATPVSKVQAEDKDEKVAAVKKVDRELTEAYIKADLKEVDRLTSEDYVHTTPHGKIYGKKHILMGLTDGRLTFEKIDDSDVKVAIHGDTAVVTGESKMKGKSKSRGEFHEDYRWTRVYHKHDGKWLTVAEHMSRVIPDEKKKEEK